MVFRKKFVNKMVQIYINVPVHRCVKCRFREYEPQLQLLIGSWAKRILKLVKTGVSSGTFYIVYSLLTVVGEVKTNGHQ